MVVGLREASLMLAGRYARLEGAHGLVRDTDGRVLAVRPLFPPREWTLPGGKVTARETPEDAAGREVREETGIRVAVERCLLVDARHPRSTDFVFGCRLVGGDLQPQADEIAEVRWLTADELRALAPKLAILLDAIPPTAEHPIYLGAGQGSNLPAT